MEKAKNPTELIQQIDESDAGNDAVYDGKNSYDLYALAKRLESNEFCVEVFNTPEAATQYIVDRCKKKTVGLGDSETLRQINLAEKLRQTNDIDLASEKKDRPDRKEAICADIYILSANAISYDTGEIIIIDSKGNRICGGTFFPEEIIYVIGKNKIESNIIDALFRARNTAAVKNMKAHVGYNAPCEKTGYCVNCAHPDRICRITCIIHKRPKASNITIVLVDEALGF